MNPTLRNVIAVIIGLSIGMTLNGYLIGISGSIIPLPEGMDPNNPDHLKKYMPLFETRHFVMPFIAHALGTLISALITVLIAASNHMKLAMIIAIFSLIGGVLIALMIGSPWLATIVDWLFAYFPMAFIGAKLGMLKLKK